jgi:class 3 adenylate cyclase
MMPEAKENLIRYIYLDVVGFTYNRTVEAQSDIISALNGIVKQVVSQGLPSEAVIYIPIGDGICIAILASIKYDGHVQIAEDIIRRIVSVHNKEVADTRRFEVRIGINENVDNVITDINGNRNVCGAGVNHAQRIMSFADANQILVGQSIYESLRYREKYARAFRPYVAEAKHHTTLEVFQYIGGNIAALNREPPSAFAIHERKLSIFSAYYIAHAIKNRKFIDKHLKAGYDVYPLGLLLAYLAEDSVGHAFSSRLKPYKEHMPKTENKTLEEQYKVFFAMPFWVGADLHEAKVEDKILRIYPDCFDKDGEGLFVSPEGEKKLKSEWRNIWDDFSLDDFQLYG